MANYATLKAAIQQVVKTNGNNEITGALLQQSLLAMINSLGAYYQFVGIATPTTNPGTPDQNVYYIASIAGTYTNFNSIVLDQGEVAILAYNGTWQKFTSGFASEESVNVVKDENGGLKAAIYGVNYSSTEQISGETFYIRVNQPLAAGINVNIRIFGTDGIVASNVLNLKLYDSNDNVVHSGNIYINGATRQITPANNVSYIVFERISTTGSGSVTITISANSIFDNVSGFVRYDVAQELTDAQKAQARQNTGSASTEELDELEGKVLGTVEKTEITGINWVDGYYTGANLTPTGTGFASGPIPVTDYRGKTIRVTRNNNNVTARYSYYVDTNNQVQYLGSEGIYSTPDGDGNYYGDIVVPNDAVTFYISMNPNCTQRSVALISEIPGIEGDKKVFVSPNGDDSNDGTQGRPKKTIQNALGSGNIIILAGGVYNNVTNVNLNTSNYNKISIQALPGTLATIKMEADTFINDGSETLVSGYTKVYRKALATNPFGSKTTARMYQDNVNDAYTLIADKDRHPLQRGRQYRCEKTCIKQCSSIAAIEALGQNQYGFYWENGYMYFSRPTVSSSSHPILIPKFGNTFISVSKSISLSLENIEIIYGNIDIQSCTDVSIKNVSIRYANVTVNGGFSFRDCTGIVLERCEAAGITDGGITGDGFNFHTTHDNGISPYYLTARLIDCWAHDLNDDGYSDHEYSEVTIDGGLFEFCGKGGVTPSYGANDVINNVVSRYNIDESKATGNGIYVTGNPSYQRLNTSVIANGCVCYGNHFGFRAAQNQCVLICVNCISYGNDWGNWRAESGAGKITRINCKTGNGSETVDGNITTIDLT